LLVAVGHAESIGVFKVGGAVADDLVLFVLFARGVLEDDAGVLAVDLAGFDGGVVAGLDGGSVAHSVTIVLLTSGSTFPIPQLKLRGNCGNCSLFCSV
jgi:hypothetical protein